jgi:hypothetical protein
MLGVVGAEIRGGSMRGDAQWSTHRAADQVIGFSHVPQEWFLEIPMSASTETQVSRQA